MNRIGLIFGIAFGFNIAASGMGNPDAIRDMLLLRDAHLFLVMGSAVAVGVPLMLLLKRRNWQTVFNGPLAISRAAVERKHVLGSLVFGTGWALSATCPGPTLANFAAGNVLAVFVAVGLFAGLALRAEVVARQAAAAGPPMIPGSVASAT